MFIWEFLCLLIKITLVINERGTDPADIKGLVSIGLKKTIDKTDDNNLSFKMSTAGMAYVTKFSSGSLVFILVGAWMCCINLFFLGNSFLYLTRLNFRASVLFD